jgi:hypothetical protein
MLISIILVDVDVMPDGDDEMETIMANISIPDPPRVHPSGLREIPRVNQSEAGVSSARRYPIWPISPEDRDRYYRILIEHTELYGM